MSTQALKNKNKQNKNKNDKTKQKQKQQITIKKTQRYIFQTFDSQHMIFTQALMPFPFIFCSTQFLSFNKTQLNNPFLSLLTSHTELIALSFVFLWYFEDNSLIVFIPLDFNYISVCTSQLIGRLQRMRNWSYLSLGALCLFWCMAIRKFL